MLNDKQQDIIDGLNLDYVFSTVVKLAGMSDAEKYDHKFRDKLFSNLAYQLDEKHNEVRGSLISDQHTYLDWSEFLNELNNPKDNSDLQKFLLRNASSMFLEMASSGKGGHRSLDSIKKVMGDDFGSFMKRAARDIVDLPESKREIARFLANADSIRPEWGDEITKPFMDVFVRSITPENLGSAIVLNRKKPHPDLEEFIEDAIDNRIANGRSVTNLSFKSLPKRLQNKYIENFLGDDPIDFLENQDIAYGDFKKQIDASISKVLDNKDFDYWSGAKPEFFSGNIEKILNHPNADIIWKNLKHIGNEDPNVAQRKADLAFSNFENNNNDNIPFGFLSDDQQFKILNRILDLRPKGLPLHPHYIEHVSKHLDSFEGQNKSKIADWLTHFYFNQKNQLFTHLYHIGGDSKQKIMSFMANNSPQFAMEAPADFWYEYEQKVRPHHFAVGKSLHTEKPETLTDHRGDTGRSHEYMYLLPALRQYSKLTQQKIQEAIDKGELKAKNIKGKPHLWLYRGVAGNFAKSLRDLVGSGQLDPNDLTVVRHRNVKYPASPVESWSTSQSVARSFANRHITGHPSRHGVIMGAWIPVDSIVHSGFIDVFPNQPHAHEHENEFVAHIASDKPTRTVHSEDFLIDDNTDSSPIYTKTKTVKSTKSPKKAKPAPTTAVEPPTESPMSKAEKPMDQKPNAHEILSVLHGEARKNKAQDSQQTIVDQNAQIKQRIHAVANKIKEVAPQLEQLKNTHPEAFSTLMESIKAMMTMAKQYVPQEAQKPTEPMQKARIEVRHPPGVRSPSMITGASADAKPTHRSGKIFTMEPDQTGEVKKKKREARSGLIMNPATGAAVSVRQAPHEQKHPDAVKVT